SRVASARSPGALLRRAASRLAAGAILQFPAPGAGVQLAGSGALVAGAAPGRGPLAEARSGTLWRRRAPSLDPKMEAGSGSFRRVCRLDTGVFAAGSLRLDQLPGELLRRSLPEHVFVGLPAVVDRGGIRRRRGSGDDVTAALGSVFERGDRRSGDRHPG